MADNVMNNRFEKKVIVMCLSASIAIHEHRNPPNGKEGEEGAEAPPPPSAWMTSLSLPPAPLRSRQWKGGRGRASGLFPALGVNALSAGRSVGLSLWDTRNFSKSFLGLVIFFKVFALASLREPDLQFLSFIQSHSPAPPPSV